jgi:polar amino acid transport system permease protein
MKKTRRPRRRLWPDFLILLTLAAAGAGVALRAQHQVPYDWDWKSLVPYLVRTEPALAPGLLLQGVAQTLRLSCWGGLIAIVLGAVGGLCRVSHWPYLRALSACLIHGIRNIPPLVLVFLGYFFLADQIPLLSHLHSAARTATGTIRGLLEFAFGPVSQMHALWSAACILGLMEGAYVAEIVRTGIESIPRGQWDAGSALGLSQGQILRHVVLPQALRVMVPPLAGQGISTVKDSAIMAVISIQELTFQGMQLRATTYRTFEVWTAVAVIYFLLTTVLSSLAQMVEGRLARGHASMQNRLTAAEHSR